MTDPMDDRHSWLPMWNPHTPFGAVPLTAAHNTLGTTVQPELIARLRQAIQAEYNAIRTYGKLAKWAPNADARQVILDIQADEARHFQAFSAAYAELTGGERVPLEKGPLPTDYRAGVDESIRDELRDSKFYQETSRLAANPVIRRELRQASQDEARHATWFLYLWQQPPA